MSGPPAATPEEPSRYTRSFGGLIAAMVVTVLFVAAYVGFRALTRDQPEVGPEEIDYLTSVGQLQEAGTTVTYPRALPDGWIATRIDFEPGAPPQWGLNMLTAGGRFVGVRQEETDADDLLSTYVDERPRQGEDATPASALPVGGWESWSDDGGDHAFTTTFDSGPLAGQTLLVYGPASEADLEALIGELTLDPVGDPPG